MKHTPGPWSTYVNTTTNVVVRKMFADGLESSEICRVKSANAIPDASLIAAAPDLFDALQLVVETAENGGWPSAALVVAKGAIAKALAPNAEVSGDGTASAGLPG